MQNRFYFGDDSVPPSQTPTANSVVDDDDEDEEYDFDTTSLPFPKPLSRPRFATESFEPHAFLAAHSTSNRFQTLEDLQTELRELSATINKELVDLVNGNYEEFVNLGVDLRGGEEKVEEVRVGLLGFERDVAMLRDRVSQRKSEVEELVKQKRGIRKEIGVGRGLLGVDERLSDLEGRLGLLQATVTTRRKSFRASGEEAGQRQRQTQAEQDDKDTWSDGWGNESVEESDEEYDDDDDDMPGRLKGLVERFLILKLLIRKYGTAHPFLVSQRERINRVRDRIKIEIETVVKSNEDAAVKQRLLELRERLDQ